MKKKLKKAAIFIGKILGALAGVWCVFWGVVAAWAAILVAFDKNDEEPE